MPEELISVIDLAKKLETRKQTVFKVLNRLGITTMKQRHSGHKNQEIAYITIQAAKQVADSFKDRRNSNEKAITDEITSSNGVFYLIQLEPTHDPGRFKVGFASCMPERLRHLRCSAPLAKLVATWPCRSLWERTAIDCVSIDCERIHTEVFRTVDIDKIQEKCKQFFSLMPNL
jgi:hypothetical protein